MNQLSSLYQYPLHLFDMNFGEISRHIQRCPSLIVPVGSLEPVGLYGGIGLLSCCAEVLAEALSSKLKVLMAPVIHYSCTTAFKSFEGCAGIRERTLINLLTETCRDWIFQGFRNILLINVSSENDDALGSAVKRLNSGAEKVKFFSLQSDLRITDRLTHYRAIKELGRSEYLILSLAKYLFSDMLRDGHHDRGHSLPDVKQFQNWKKRGKDPQLFRKMFPLGSTSELIAGVDIEIGRELFDFIIKTLEDEFTPFLNVPQNAA